MNGGKELIKEKTSEWSGRDTKRFTAVALQSTGISQSYKQRLHELLQGARELPSSTRMFLSPLTSTWRNHAEDTSEDAMPQVESRNCAATEDGKFGSGQFSSGIDMVQVISCGQNTIYIIRMKLRPCRVYI